LLRDVCDLFQPVAENRSLEILMEVPESVAVPGEPRKLQRVFSNLIDNALKYTPKGGSVNITIEEGAKDTVVTVKDTGDGIAETDLPHIFDRFFRGEKSRSTPGNGLGLSLAHAFVSVHNGTITATSSIGKGSQFVVTLPRFVPQKRVNRDGINSRGIIGGSE